LLSSAAAGAASTAAKASVAIIGPTWRRDMGTPFASLPVLASATAVLWYHIVKGTWEGS
jgi:hypothetical protein